ncbi:MAG: TatD family hydrolase [Microscillaceae bacterium]
MEWIDTHTHLYANAFAKDQAEMMQRAMAAGLNKLYLPNIDIESIAPMLALEALYPAHCQAMMGLHPVSVKEDFEKQLLVIEEWLQKRPFAAIGEMGTDLYWDKSYFAQQQEAFRIQVGWARQYGLPLVIHCRESIRETIDLLRPLLDGQLTGIFHCFTGTKAQAEEITEMGFLLGIGGVLTFKNSGLDKVLADIDLAHLVLETDSPYLAPLPHRGQRNESAYLPLIAKKLAEVKDCPLGEIARITSENARRLFKAFPAD